MFFASTPLTPLPSLATFFFLAGAFGSASSRGRFMASRSPSSRTVYRCLASPILSREPFQVEPDRRDMHLFI